MSDCVLKVEKLENGYEVEVCDPVISAANDNPKATWRDPWKGYAFKTEKEVVTFVSKILSTLSPAKDDAGVLFKQAVASDK